MGDILFSSTSIHLVGSLQSSVSRNHWLIMVPRLGVVTSCFSIKPTHQHKLWLKCASSPTSLYNSHQLSGWKNYEFVNGKDYPIYEMDFKKTWFKTTKQFSMISTYSPKKSWQIPPSPISTRFPPDTSWRAQWLQISAACPGNRRIPKGSPENCDARGGVWFKWEDTSRGGELSSFSHGMAWCYHWMICLK